MEAVISSPKEFSKLMALVAAFDPMFNMKCSKDGIKIFCMDAAKTSIIQLNMACGFFTSYNYTSTVTDELELGVNVDVLIKTLKGAKKNDILTLSHKTESDLISVAFTGTEREIKYDVKLVHIDEEVLNVPQVEYNLLIELSSKHIKSWKSDITDLTGEHIDFKPTPDNIQLSSRGDGTTITASLVQSDSLIYRTFNKPCEMGLKPKPLAVAGKIADICETVQFGWMNGAPINVKADIDNTCMISMWFAPTLDSDEEMETDA